ncbi:MAG: translation elongation factor Ts [Armatimonadetes bacterium]|nr:translation elongation factor Ts [Armatimonadota bacterium]
MIKELREKTGAGMMACRDALANNEGDVQKAMDFLRQKGIASADKKKDRVTSQGLIEAYIHTGGKIGVLLELNCETDFVAKTDGFKALARELAMHVAAMSPTFVSASEIPPEALEKEKEGYRQIAIEEGKKPEFVDKIAEGKVAKYFEKVCLLDQVYVRAEDGKKTVGEHVKESIGKLGENIVVRRFTRFVLGEA